MEDNEPDPIQEILDEHPDVSDFLEIEAQVGDSEQRARLITGGFWDLVDLQNETTAFPKQFCEVIRAVQGNHAASAVSVFAEMTLIRFVLCGVCTHMVMRPLDFEDINQDRLERNEEWFEPKKEAKDDTAVTKFTDGCNKRDWAESITTHFQHKLNPKALPRSHVLRLEPDPLVVQVDQGWGNPDFDQELMEHGRHN
jgi:hypothetical protein